MISITRWLYLFLSYTVATGTVGMMALTVADVAGRYIFSAPLPGGSELIGCMLGVSIMAAMPLVSANRNHIAVSVLDERLGARAREIARRIVEALCIAGSSLIAVSMLARGAYLLDTAERSQILRWVLWPGAFFIAALWIAVAIAHVAGAINPPAEAAKEEAL